MNMYQTVIIDDEPFIVDGLVHSIDWSGYQLEIAFASTDPVAALDYILANPVNIVITDVSMPILNGLQLIQRIKEVKPSIFVVVLSAYDNFEYARTALRYGAENYLLKPLDPDELSDTVSQIISHIQEREQLSNTYGRAILSFRNSFTEQWLKNLLSNNDLSTKAELLGINLNAPCYTVIIFSSPSHWEGGISQFFDLFLQYLPGRYTGNFFFETPARLAGVLSPVHTDEEDIREFLMPILQLAATCGYFVFASVGTTVFHYSQVHQSYHQADTFAFFEYTSLPFLFYQGHPALMEAAHQALNVYDSSYGSREDAVIGLFQPGDEFLCSGLLLSKRISSLCKKEYELGEKYPVLAELLSSFPISPDDCTREAYIRFTMKFLESSNQLLAKVQQSMYPCVNAVIKNVHEFSDKDISLKTLAARLNVTPSYLGTVFHQQTGYYFNDYLAEARLKYAADLLEHSDLKIKDIVDIIGFSSQTYFNRSFKRYFDTSPVNYRRDKKVTALT